MALVKRRWVPVGAGMVLVIGLVPLILRDSQPVRSPGGAASTTPATPPSGTAPSPPSPTRTSAAPEPVAVLLAAGDIASCNSGGDEVTGRMLDGLAGTIAPLGDLAYPNGSATNFARCFDPSWGRHRGRMRPAVGNHEYVTSGAGAYFRYFGPAAGNPNRGYYSYDLGDWHVVVLNSNCDRVACAAGSAQERWLRADLAAATQRCTLAYWHHPLFTSGANHAGEVAVRPLYRALYDAGVEVVLAGHNHQYERFAPLSPDGAYDPARGIRSFVVGTGGGSHYPFGTVQRLSEARNSTAYGLLRLTLRATSYSWQFVPEPGRTFRDSGTGTCH
jgi:hypothetical protein